MKREVLSCHTGLLQTGWHLTSQLCLQYADNCPSFFPLKKSALCVMKHLCGPLQCLRSFFRLHSRGGIKVSLVFPWPSTCRGSCCFPVRPSSVPRPVRHEWCCPARLQATDRHRLPNAVSTEPGTPPAWLITASQLCFTMALHSKQAILQSLYSDQHLLPRLCPSLDLPGVSWVLQLLSTVSKGDEASRAGWCTVERYLQKQLWHLLLIGSWWMFAWGDWTITYSTSLQPQRNF